MRTFSSRRALARRLLVACVALHSMRGKSSGRCSWPTPQDPSASQHSRVTWCAFLKRTPRIAWCVRARRCRNRRMRASAATQCPTETRPRFSGGWFASIARRPRPRPTAVGLRQRLASSVAPSSCRFVSMAPCPTSRRYTTRRRRRRRRRRSDSATGREQSVRTPSRPAPESTRAIDFSVRGYCAN